MALLKSFPSSQAEDFFAPLPQAITSCLRQAPCIATEDGDWVLPAEAVICKDASAARWQLLAQATSAGVAGAKYIHPDLTILHRSSALQSALGIKSLDVDHYLQVLHSAHAQGMLPGLGMQWCAQMLACIYEMLAAKEPQLRSLHTHGMAHTTGVQSVCQQLQSLPVFPLTSGAWTCLGDDPDHPLFQAGPHMRSRAGAKMVTASTTHADRSERQETGSTTGPLEAALESCGLRVEDMQLRVLAADFVQPAEKDTDSLSQMLQASSQVLSHAMRHVTATSMSQKSCVILENYFKKEKRRLIFCNQHKAITYSQCIKPAHTVLTNSHHIQLLMTQALHKLMTVVIQQSLPSSHTHVHN